MIKSLKISNGDYLDGSQESLGKALQAFDRMFRIVVISGLLIGGFLLWFLLTLNSIG